MTDIIEIKDPVQRLFAFCKERQSIYKKKMAGKKPPWTNDEILRDYRFCNIYREQDKVTVWIRDNWRDPHNDDPELWFAMCIARLLNRPDSLAVLEWPVPIDDVPEIANVIGTAISSKAARFSMVPIWWPPPE